MARKKKQAAQKKDTATLRAEVEAILFAAAKRVSMEELKRLCSAEEDSVLEALQALKEELEERNSAVMLQEDDRLYKLTIREKYLPLVEDIVTETELPKSVLETLAVIAFRHPIYQSDLVKIRSNKCYDHLADLEERGFIRREKAGRTKIIHLTQKFFDYFELPPNKVKEAFASYEAVSREIEKKEFETLEEGASGSGEEETSPTVSVVDYGEKQSTDQEPAEEETEKEEPDQFEVPPVESYSEDTTPMGEIEIINEDATTEEAEGQAGSDEAGQSATGPAPTQAQDSNEDGPAEEDDSVPPRMQPYPYQDTEDDYGEATPPQSASGDAADEADGDEESQTASDYFAHLQESEDDSKDESGDDAKEHLYEGDSQASSEDDERHSSHNEETQDDEDREDEASYEDQPADGNAQEGNEESQGKSQENAKVEEQADKIIDQIDKRVDEIFAGKDESSEGSARDKRLQSMSEDIEKEKDELKE